MANITQQIIGSGISATAAANISGSVSVPSALVATGTNQATALVLGSAYSRIITAAAGTGVTPLPQAAPGDEYYVYNGGANAILFYPPGSDTINAAATSFSIASGKSVILTKDDTTHWSSLLSA
jgi:hypothetical protein